MDTPDHIASVLRSFDIEPKPLDRILDAYLRRHRELSSANRRTVADAAFGVMRWRRRLQGLIKMRGGKENDVRLQIELYLNGGHLISTMPKKFPGGEAAFYSFPDFLYRKLVASYGKTGAAEMATSLNTPARTTLRANTLRATRSEAMEMLKEEGIEAEPARVSPFGFHLKSRVNLDASGAYKQGLVEVQDEGSQLAVIASWATAGETVLDACAGAGGKSLMLAMLMQNKGRIVAADLQASKLKELKLRAARAGVGIIRTCQTEQLLADPKLKGKFDLVFLDVPCSGIGTIRRSPDLKWRLTEDVVRERVKEQLRLIDEYADWVRPGGRLAYVTCSILPEENEDVAESIAKRGDFEIVDIKGIFKCQGLAPSDEKFAPSENSLAPSDGLLTSAGHLKTDPRRGGWDGFFAAVFKKTRNYSGGGDSVRRIKARLRDERIPKSKIDVA